MRAIPPATSGLKQPEYYRDEESRREYREMVITTPGLDKFIGGVILYDETIRQATGNGTPFVQIIQEAGIIPGIKVDLGEEDLAAHPGEKITAGLDGLRERLADYSKMGARFAKWRSVITVGEFIPSRGCIEANMQTLARYAALCQESEPCPHCRAGGPDGGHTFHGPVSRCY
jgi:fructose-bisphosphate aldolase class I